MIRMSISSVHSVISRYVRIWRQQVGCPETLKVKSEVLATSQSSPFKGSRVKLAHHSNAGRDSGVQSRSLENSVIDQCF